MDRHASSALLLPRVPSVFQVGVTNVDASLVPVVSITSHASDAVQTSVVVLTSLSVIAALATILGILHDAYRISQRDSAPVMKLQSVARELKSNRL